VRSIPQQTKSNVGRGAESGDGPKGAPASRPKTHTKGGEKWSKKPA